VEHPCPAPGCGMVAKTRGGLSSHLRHRHDGQTFETQAAESQVVATRRQIPPDAPSALVAAAMHLALAIDLTDSPRDLAQLVRELRATLADIAAATASDDVEEADSVDDLAARRRRRQADPDMVGRA